MGDKSNIEWTDATWNPVRGCALVSHGCTNCYAMRQAHRTHGAGGAYEGLTKMTSHGPVWTGAVRLVPKLLDQPLRWRRPRRIFVNSMSDLFHEDVPFRFVDRVFAVMAMCSRHGRDEAHTFQILTKRPRRMLEYLSNLPSRIDRIFHAMRALATANNENERAGCTYAAGKGRFFPLPDVWLGVSVEDQATADARIPLLLQTPAAVRWISAEPLLGPINLPGIGRPQSARETPGPRLDWVVAGGESGPRARPSHIDWFRSLRDQCQTAGVPFFFKQWGEYLPGEYDPKKDVSIVWQNGSREFYGDHADIKYAHSWFVYNAARPLIAYRVGKKAAGNLLDGRTWQEYPR